MRRDPGVARVRWFGAIAVVAAVLGGCGRAAATIPPGAQEVHVTVSGSEVRLAPARIRPGDVYVVLDTPGSSVGFAQRQRTAAETPGPMREEDLARLARGSTEGMSIGGFDDIGCSDQQRAEDRGRMGPCGNVFKVPLGSGKVAFFTGGLDGGPPSGDSKSIAVLEVVP